MLPNDYENRNSDSPHPLFSKKVGDKIHHNNLIKNLSDEYKKFKKSKKIWKTVVNAESKDGTFEITNLSDNKLIRLDIFNNILTNPVHSITFTYKEFKELTKFIKKIS
jgi:hypothetical protein